MAPEENGMNVQPVAGEVAATTEDPDICVIFNVGSGKRKGAEVEKSIRAAMDRHPGRFVLRTVRRGKRLAAEAEDAAAEGFPILVAAGGDGTISAVAAAAHRHGRTLGVVPMGTFNYFARSFGLPEDLDAAMDLVAAGPTRTISVGEVNGRVFLNNASLGLYPAILARREGIYHRWGRSRLAAHWSVLSTFLRFNRAVPMDVTIDGETMRTRTPLAFAARNAYQLELFELPGVDDVRNGRFALFLAPDATRWSLILFALRLAWGSSDRGRDFRFLSGKAIDIETGGRPRLVARDGEREVMRPPFRFRVLVDALTIIAGPEEAA
jgi:diacylglycerol kinase family enzyme